MKLLPFFVIFIFLLFTACQTQTATLPAAVAPVLTATAISTSLPTASATIPSTLTPTPQPAVVTTSTHSLFGEKIASAFDVTPTPSPTAYVCGCPSHNQATATPFPTVPAAEFLPNKYHLWAETAGFILSLPWTDINFVSAYPETNEGLDEYEQQTREYQWSEFDFSVEAQQIFEDINGDGAEDLIVTDIHLVAIFLWQDTAYQSPFVWFSEYPLIASLEDWTADGVNELVYQEATYDHWGTGVFSKGWGPTVIYCQLTHCDIVFSTSLIVQSFDMSKSGANLGWRTLTKGVNPAGEPTIHIHSQRLMFYHHYFTINSIPITATNEEWQNPEWVRIPPQSETTYTWTGETFTKTEYITTPNTVVLPEANTVAKHPDFGVAQVQIESNYSADSGNDVCLVLWQETPITSRPFGCKKELTYLTWQDVTQDGQAELLVATTSGYNPNFGEKYGWEGEEIDCIHQRLIIYTLKTGRLTQIADVVGCVVNDTLFGVRLEDINQDGQVEILTGGRSWYGEPICYHYNTGHWTECWQGYDPRPETYVWNGIYFGLTP